MEPKFIRIDEKKVVGLGTSFISILSPDQNAAALIPRLWDEFEKRRHEIPDQVADTAIGYCEGIPEAQRKHPHELLYLACTEVRHLNAVPAGMIAKRVPAGRYAVFTHKGKLDTLGQTYGFIFKTWMPGSGEKSREAPELEIYDHRFKFGSDDSEMDIYIPMQ